MSSNNAGQMLYVVCKFCGSDKDLNHIYHVVILYPECRCSASVCQLFESFFKPLLKYCHYWICVAGSHLSISHLQHEDPHVSKLLFSEGMFHDVLMHALRVVNIVFRSLGSLSVTGKKSICVLCFASSANFLHPSIPVGVWELRILGLDHPSCCPVCIAWSEMWLIISQRESSANGEQVMVFIPLCFLLVN